MANFSFLGYAEVRKKTSCGWVGGFGSRIMPRCGSILQAGTCQILSLAENPRWSPSVAKITAEIVATNVVASRPPERQPTATPTARAKIPTAERLEIDFLLSKYESLECFSLLYTGWNHSVDVLIRKIFFCKMDLSKWKPHVHRLQRFLLKKVFLIFRLKSFYKYFLIVNMS